MKSSRKPSLPSNARYRESLTGRTISGLFWTASSSGAQALLKLIVVAFLGRLLTESDFGVVTAALTVIALSEVFVKLGIGPAIVQRATLEPRHLRVGFTLMFIFGSAVTTILWFSSPYIASFFQMEELVPMLRVLSFNFIIQSCSVVSTSLTFRNFNFRRREGIRTFSYAFGYGLVGIVLAFLGYGAWSLIIAVVAQQTIATILYNITEPHSKFPLFDTETARELLYFGSGQSLGSLLFKVAGQGDNLIVARTLGADALGIYGRAYQLMILPASLFQQMLDRVLFPTLSKVQDDVVTLGRAYRRGLMLTSLFTLPSSVVLFVFAPEYVYLILGGKWSEAVPPFQILAIGMIFRNTAALNDTISRATGAVYNRAWRQGVYAVSVVTGAYIGHFFGITGVAVGTLIAIMINFFMMTQLSLRLVNLTWTSVFAVYRQVATLALLLGVESLVMAAFLRNAAVPEIATALTSAVVVAATVLGLARFAPRWAFGEDGIWMFDQLKRFMPGVSSLKMRRE